MQSFAPHSLSTLTSFSLSSSLDRHHHSCPIYTSHLSFPLNFSSIPSLRSTISHFTIFPSNSSSSIKRELEEVAEFRKNLSNFTRREAEKLPENVKTFNDVKGCGDAKEELKQVVEFLKNPSKFTRLGGKLPKGILLTGPPGTGKTLLAKAIAGEAGVPFFYRAGSEFEDWSGARRVRSLFKAAKKKAPCIIFIDEIDGVGLTREYGTNEVLNQLLVEMDGFEQNKGIILVAATNLPDILDPALTRPGRFDMHIIVTDPDVRGRQEILEFYLQDKPLADDVDINAIARGTQGFNGADLENLVNIAAIKAAAEGAEKLTAAQLEVAKDRIIMGTESKTIFVSEETKKFTAYHESGHAIVALNSNGADPIHKATIMPHGSSLGMVTHLPASDDVTTISKKELLACLDVCMGGRVAEELIFGMDNVTTGASGDLRRATEIAQYMVTDWGMSDAIGPVYIRKPSSEMRSLIDAEVMKLLKEAYDRVKVLLKKNEKALHALANALLEHETLDAEEIKRILLPYSEGEGSRWLPEQQEQVEAQEPVLV